MKKLFYAIMVLASLTLVSCDKDPIGGTATEKLAGQWYVTAQTIDANGSVLAADPFGIGKFMFLTYNTSDNKSNEMWVRDVDGDFWDFQVKVNCDLSASTFSVANGEDIINGAKVNITNGKVLFGAAKTPSGMPADSIVFDVVFSNDKDAIPNGGTAYDHLRVTGYRYTGLANDD